MSDEPKLNPNKKLDLAIEYFEAGNFRMTSKITKEILSGDYKEELKAKAKELSDKLKFDRTELFVGLGSLLLLLSLYIYFGFIR